MSDQSLIQTADDSSFDEVVLKSSIPVLVDFGADWCVQCKAFAPVIVAIAEQFQGRLKVVAIDADKSPSLADRFNLSSLPALFFFKSGEECGDLPGMMPKSKLIEMIEDFLAV